ncbi:hypothetical protein VNO77_33079 [Canavalia gladiata]|uniref:Kinesin motor domain-containing protein n=1 Tax=Canavalia gladiata TaxID=3824 RepID=A0AAN9Q071_CANGL
MNPPYNNHTTEPRDLGNSSSNYNRINSAQRKVLSESKFQRVLHTPLMTESSTTLMNQVGVGHKFPEVFQLKHGNYADLPPAKISELMKSTTLDNAPTQSLLSVVNGILEESVERRNGEIPHRVACLLRKVVQEIERRISTQAEHLRTQNNHFKAREEKYQSRIKVLEVLASGTREGSEVSQILLARNHTERTQKEEKKTDELKQIEKGKIDAKKEDDLKQIEKTKKEEKKTGDSLHAEKTKEGERRADDKEVIRLVKELEDKSRQISTLKLELETMKKTNEVQSNTKEEEKKEDDKEVLRLIKELEGKSVEISTLKLELETMKKTQVQTNTKEEEKREDDKEVIRLIKELEDKSMEISTLKLELETIKKTHVQSKTKEEEKREDDKEVIRLVKEVEEKSREISTLKLELETMKKTHEIQEKSADDKEVIRLREELEEKSREISTLKLELETMKKTHEIQTKTKEEEKSEDDKEVIRLREELEEKSREISTFKLELETMKKTHEVQTKTKEEEKREDDKEVIRLIKELEEKSREISTLKLELETTKKTHEVQTKTREEEKREDDKEVIRLIKEMEEKSREISTLKLELETKKKTHEVQTKTIEEEKRENEKEVIRLVKEMQDKNMEVSTLKQELETMKKTYVVQCLKLEEEANDAKGEMKQKSREYENLLEKLRNKLKENEALSLSNYQKWNMKENQIRKTVNFQCNLLQQLKLSWESTKQEAMKEQMIYAEECNRLGVNLKSLVDAAENYQTVLAENRKLFNEVQELKGNIRVYCRLRPFLPGQKEKQSIVEHFGETDLVVANPSKQGKDALKTFKFNKVFGPVSTQAEVYADIQAFIRSVLDGYNVCIFAYGQTGSGKTYTMSGPNGATSETVGVNYRALNDLFSISTSRKSSIVYEIGVQIIEIYNEQVRDLLSSEATPKKYPFSIYVDNIFFARLLVFFLFLFEHIGAKYVKFMTFDFLDLHTLGILNHSQPNGLAVPDASMYPVKETSDVMKLMDIGLKNRAKGSTAMNERSSRSHSVVSIHVRGIDQKSGSSLHGNLHLVDLAGSERVDRSEVTGDRLKEAQHINKSLSALGDVIFSLSQKNAHVPYRNSKLTQLLQSSLGGQAKTLMLVQINSDQKSFSESLSTLKFAERVSGVELGAAKSTKDGRDVRELMEQVSSLKDTILVKDEEIERLQILKDLKNVYPSGDSEKPENAS